MPCVSPVTNKERPPKGVIPMHIGSMPQRATLLDCNRHPLLAILSVGCVNANVAFAALNSESSLVAGMRHDVHYIHQC